MAPETGKIVHTGDDKDYTPVTGNLRGHTTSQVSGLSREKAKKILKDGKVHGKPLTKKQRGLMGAKAAGKSTKTRR